MKNKYIFLVNTDETIRSSLTNLLQNAISSVKNSLQTFALNPTFSQSIDTIFNYQDSNWLKHQWQSRNVEFPTIEVVNGAVINNANGAYAEQTNTIYLASEFLLAHQSDIDIVAAVLLEEYGHYLDSQINSEDTPGDEGAIFSAVVRGKELSNSELQQLRSEDDSAIVTIDGETIQIEQATGSNPFYEYEVIAETGSSNLTSIGKGVSINDSGNVAFSAKGTTVTNAVYVKFENFLDFEDITKFDREFGDYVQINNNNQVVATERANSNGSVVRVWNANNPGTDNNFIDTTNNDFNAILSAPSIGDNDEFVFSALDESDFTVVTTSEYATNDNFNVAQNTLNLGAGGQRARPMMDENGNFVMRFLNRDSPIVLFEPTGDFTGRTFNTTSIVAASDGFSNRGLSPGINDDGQIIGFFASLSQSGADTINTRQSNLQDVNGNPIDIPDLTPGDGIFASTVFNSERIITRIAGVAGNGQLDPGETFEDSNNDGVVDLGEDIGIFSSFDSDSRVGIGFSEDREQFVYMGFDESGNKGVYTSFLNLDFATTSNVEQSKIYVSDSQLIAEVGETLPESTDTIQNIEIYDPITNNGQIAFWTETNSGQETIIKASPNLTRRPVLILPGIAGNYAKVSKEQEWLLKRGVHPDLLQIDPLGGVYNDLIQSFKNAGYTEGEDLFIANYDWRLPPGPLDNNIDGKIDGLIATKIADEEFLHGVDYLGYFLRKASEEWKSNNPSAPPLESVDIVAHSTGGLVARTYIQSDAYGEVFNTNTNAKLPTIENFVMLGVPNRGAAKAWNPLHNDWDADITYKYILSKIVNLAYQKVLAGETIEGLEDSTWEHPGAISEDTIEDSNGNPDLEEFIRQYVPTIKTLLATYPFIDRGNGLETVNQNQDVKDPDSRNSLVLDLNAGLDLNVNGDPNGFADEVGEVTVIYGASEDTITTVTELQGSIEPQIAGFQDFDSREAASDEIWYRDNLNGQNNAPNGDATVPLESSIGQFNVGKPNITLKGFLKRENTNGDVTHTGLVSNPDVQLEVFESLGVGITSSSISTGLALPNVASLVRTLSAIGQSQNANITTTIFDPVEGFVVDANGNRLGYSQETGVLNEIPNSIYLGEEDGIGWIFDDVAEPLEIQLTGLGENYYVQVSSLQQGREVGGFESSGFLASGEQQSFTVEIEEVEDNTNNQNPIAEDDEFSIDYGTFTLTGNVLSNDRDSDEDKLTVNELLVEQPSQGSVSIQTDGSFTYSISSSSSNFIGTDSFVYEISDSQGNTDTATVTLDISPNIEFPFQVGEVNLIKDSSNQFASSRLTAPLADGGFITIGDQAATEFLPGGIIAQRYNPQGQPVGNSFLIHIWSEQKPFAVSLASSPDGGFSVLFNDSGQTLLKIYDEEVNLVAEQESYFNSESSVNRQSGVINGDSSAALKNGNYVIVPELNNLSPNNDNEFSGFIGVEIYDNQTGELLNNAFPGLVNPNTGKIPDNNIIDGTDTVPEIQELREPKVAALSNGGFVVSYLADKRNVNTGEFESKIYAQVFDAEGNKLEENILVAPTTKALLQFPAITSLNDGGFVIAYTNYSQQYRDTDTIPENEGIVAKRYDNNGNAVGGLIPVRVGVSGIERAVSPSVIGLNDGRFIVAYTPLGELTDEPVHEFIGQLYDNDGTQIGDEFVIDTFAKYNFRDSRPGSPYRSNNNRQLALFQTEDSTLLLTGKENDGDSEANDYADDYVYTQRLKLNVTEEEVSVEPIGSVSTLAQYAGENPPFDPQPIPNTDDGGNNESDSQLSINDVSVVEGNEGNTELVFTVSLLEASDETITVDYATEDDIAIAAEDYIATEGTLEFTPGEIEKTITVQILGDTDFEEDETFDVRLSNSNNASLADGRGIATITNDDSTEEITITIDDVSVAEGNEENSEATFTVSLSEASDETITVDYATEDDLATAAEDYIATEGTLEFTPGETQKTITVQILGDTDFEENETFDVRLSNPIDAVLSDSRGVGTIEDDDAVTVEDTIELFRMRNKTFATGTYVFVGEAERDFILNDENLSNTFALDGVEEDGTMNPAFTASTEDGDNLIPFYRLESLAVPGTFLFVSTAEYEFIFNDSVQSEQWKKQGFNEADDTVDIPEFYLMDSSADVGIQFNRFQNLQNGTFLYAGEAETQAIANNADLSGLFVNQGVAFESFV